ncbi:MAG: J domain-containing protein [Acidimicrobiales bacterium]
MVKDPFEVLGVAADATLTQAEAAYRRLVQLFHPDRLQGLRQDVQAEAEQRLREVNEAMRVVRARFGRQPVYAPGHEPPPGPPPAPGGPGIPVRATRADPGSPAWVPSDSATDAEAKLYDVELRAVDGSPFHVAWGGRHAAALLAALRHAHRPDGPIRQVEWGTYEVVLDGAATRRLLSSVLSDNQWPDEKAVVVQAAAEVDARLPVPAGTAAAEAVRAVNLGTVLELLDDRRSYSVLADVY